MVTMALLHHDLHLGDPATGGASLWYINGLIIEERKGEALAEWWSTSVLKYYMSAPPTTFWIQQNSDT